MEVFVDNVSEKYTAKKVPYLNLNLAVKFGDDEIVYILGCQIIKGVINAPAFKAGWKYAALNYTTPKIAAAIYEAVKRELAGNWPGHVLHDLDVATDGLKLKVADFIRLFPNLASQGENNETD